MSHLCAFCGMPGERLCQIHTLRGEGGTDPKTWHQANRIWCNYFHRGVQIERVPPGDLPPTWQLEMTGFWDIEAL